MELEKKFEIETSTLLFEGDKSYLSAEQIATLTASVLRKGNFGDIAEVEEILDYYDYYHEDEVFDKISDRKFKEEAESKGFVHEDDITVDKLAYVNTHNQAIVEWKIESVLRNIDKFTQEEFEEWLLVKNKKDKQII